MGGSYQAKAAPLQRYVSGYDNGRANGMMNGMQSQVSPSPWNSGEDGQNAMPPQFLQWLMGAMGKSNPGGGYRTTGYDPFGKRGY